MVYDLVFWVAVCVTILVVAYLVVRVMSYAYFRSKLEHFRLVQRELKDEGEK